MANACRHKLIRVTQIGNPDMADGKPTAAFIDPTLIDIISRAIGSFGRIDNPQLRHPYQECTVITLTTGKHIHVTEAPETVAELRERALE